MIQVFESYDADDGSLSLTGKKYTEDEIAAETAKISGPAASAHILEFFLRNSQHPEPRFEQLTFTSLARLIEKERPGYGEYLSAEIFAAYGKTSMASLWSAFLLEALERHEADIRVGIMKGAASRVTDELARNGFTANHKQLSETAARETEEQLKKPADIYALFDSGAVLEAVPEWKELLKETRSELESYSRIDRMLKGRAVKPESMRRYHTDPAHFEQEHFLEMRSAAEKIFSENKEAALKGAAVPDYAALLSSIEPMRRRNVSTVKGGEADEFITHVRNGIEKTAAAALTSYENALFREGELLKTDEPGGADRSRVLEAAKTAYEKDRKALTEYIDASEAFVRHLVLMKRKLSEDALALFTEKLSASIKGIEFVKKLVVSGAGVSDSGSDFLNRKYTGAVQLTPNFFKRDEDRSGISRELQISLKPADLASARKDRERRAEAVHACRIEIKSAYKNYSDRRREFLTRKNEAANRLDANIAQHEIDTIYKSAKEYVALFETHRYAEEIISYYSTRFSEFETAAGTGQISKDLEYAVKMNSIFSTIKSFDAKKLDREYRTRVYVKKSALVELSRLTTLINFYRKKNISIGFAPSAEELASLKAALNRYPSAKIAEWRMTETNYAEVDRKAAKKLEDTINRRAWSTDAGASNPLARPETFSMNGSSLFTYLPPAGWHMEGRAGSSEGRTGYASPDGESVIKIIVTDISGGLKEAGERYSVKGPVKPVMKKWGKKGDTEYYWFITRAKDGRLSETYSININGKTVVINGTAPRSRYNVFKVRFDALFNSIDI
jgi:hypothetical protein